MPYHEIYQNLINLPPNDWSVTHFVGGAQGGVYFVPEFWTGNGVPLNFNLVPEDQRMNGHRLLFEFFQLETNWDVKISARVLITDGDQNLLVGPNTLFGELQGLALQLGCPQPQAVGGTITRTCAVWPERRPVFQRNDFAGMAVWIRNFLVDPPQSFRNFVEGARPILHGAYPPQQLVL